MPCKGSGWICGFPVILYLRKVFSSKKRFPQSYNLGKNEWNISTIPQTTPPPPHSILMIPKMAGFGPHASSSLLWGKGELIVPFHSVQDCRLLNFSLKTQPESIFLCHLYWNRVKKSPKLWMGVF